METELVSSPRLGGEFWHAIPAPHLLCWSKKQESISGVHSKPVSLAESPCSCATSHQTYNSFCRCRSYLSRPQASLDVTAPGAKLGLTPNVKLLMPGPRPTRSFASIFRRLRLIPALNLYWGPGGMLIASQVGNRGRRGGAIRATPTGLGGQKKQKL